MGGGDHCVNRVDSARRTVFVLDVHCSIAQSSLVWTIADRTVQFSRDRRGARARWNDCSVVTALGTPGIVVLVPVFGKHERR